VTKLYAVLVVTVSVRSADVVLTSVSVATSDVVWVCMYVEAGSVTVWGVTPMHAHALEYAASSQLEA
jgi:hypothetical protein